MDRISLLLLSLSFLFTACQQTQTDSNGRIVKVHLTSEPPAIHPYNTVLASKARILDHVYQYLATTDPQSGQLVPQLLQTLPVLQADGSSYRFTLDQDAAWPDGQAITSEDVLFSLKVLACPQVNNPAQKSYLEYLAGFQADPEDPKQFVVSMSAYYMHNENLGLYGYILDERAYDTAKVLAQYPLESLLSDTSLRSDPNLIAWASGFNDSRMGTEPNMLQSGSGPYKVVSWEKGRRIVLQRNEQYWGAGKSGWQHAQDAEEIRYEFITDPQQVELAFQRGDLDVSTYLSPDSYKRMAKDEDLTSRYAFELRKRPTVVFVSINNKADGIKHPAFLRDTRVRRAMALSLPLNRILYQDLDSPMVAQAFSPVSEGNQLFHPALGPFPYLPDSAVALLEAAGWVDTDQDGIRDQVINGRKEKLSFSFLHQPKPDLVIDLVTLLKQEWAKVGIGCELVSMGAREYRKKYVYPGDYDAALMTLTSNFLPYEFKQIWHSDNYPDGFNFMGFDHPVADSLINQLRIESDVPTRQQLAYRVQEIIQEEQPVIFLFVPTTKVMARKDWYEGLIDLQDPYVWVPEMKE